MLGLVKSSPNWHFVANGKHPALKDYFSLGPSIPLVQGFVEWVKTGYQVFIAKADPARGLCSWRFWARGPEREGLACGLLKDSSDRIGRSYPLLILGTGPLNGWEESWDFLPMACETTWNQMEYLSARMFNDIEQLENELKNIHPPLFQWTEMAARRGNFEDSWAAPGFQESSWNPRNLEEQVAILSDKNKFFICLDQGSIAEQTSWASFWHFYFKTKEKIIPNAIFMGGTLDKAFLALFKRPLIPSDFIRLWSISSYERENYYT